MSNFLVFFFGPYDTLPNSRNFCLGVGLKIPIFMELTGEFSGATGFETDVDPVTHSDISVNLIVSSETTTISSPEEFDVGIAGNRSLHIFNFTSLGGAKA